MKIIFGWKPKSNEEAILWATESMIRFNIIKQKYERNYHRFPSGFYETLQRAKNVKAIFKPVIAVFPLLFPRQSLTRKQVGQAMINTVLKGYPKQVLEVKDVKALAETLIKF